MGLEKQKFWEATACVALQRETCDLHVCAAVTDVMGGRGGPVKMEGRLFKREMGQLQ